MQLRTIPREEGPTFSSSGRKEGRTKERGSQSWDIVQTGELTELTKEVPLVFEFGEVGVCAVEKNESGGQRRLPSFPIHSTD